MRGYFSTYSCFFVFFLFRDENMFIHFVPLICLLSAPCQSLDGCSSSEVTLTLTKELSSITVMHTNILMLLIWWWEYIQELFWISSVKLLSSGIKDPNNANRMFEQHGWPILISIGGENSEKNKKMKKWKGSINKKIFYILGLNVFISILLVSLYVQYNVRRIKNKILGTN